MCYYSLGDSMEFLQLKYFCHAAKTENFSHTAEAFLVPASSVSSSIKKLEEELGVQLFNRSSNKLSLNENGMVFLKTANSIFNELEKAKNNFKELAGHPGGKIKILINNNRHIITRIISEFKSKYPDVAFIMDFGEGRNYSDYDIVITDSIIKSSDFESKSFITEEIMLAVHKTNPLSKRKQVSISMLAGEKFLSLHKNHSLRKISDDLFSKAGINPDIAIECDDPQCIRDYLEMKTGVSLVPSVS